MLVTQHFGTHGKITKNHTYINAFLFVSCRISCPRATLCSTPLPVQLCVKFAFRSLQHQSFAAFDKTIDVKDNINDITRCHVQCTHVSYSLHRCQIHVLKVRISIHNFSFENIY